MYEKLKKFMQENDRCKFPEEITEKSLIY